ncbi:uncharacterized protein LOC125544686 [Triticum urartu]|uniref:uncharacterized protein LOC125544686 n=1 Tax=Triticum urartu TaxID=4572 RepID=UPI002044C519|nr:uncharacterized protein LOC125544686 [Triticum urartu]
MARCHPAATSAKHRAAPPNPSPPPPPVDGSLPLLHAASRGDLRLFKRLVRDLNQGRGRPREVVEAAKDQGLVALHFAAGKGRPRVCGYLVEELGVDVDAVDDGELGYRKLYVDQEFTTVMLCGSRRRRRRLLPLPARRATTSSRAPDMPRGREE